MAARPRVKSVRARLERREERLRAQALEEISGARRQIRKDKTVPLDRVESED